MLWLLVAVATIAGVWAIYPGELSWLPCKGNRWLYNRAAAGYHQKWQRHDYRAYDALILEAVTVLGHNDSPARIADLACGSGRATLVAASRLGIKAHYLAVDFSAAMLAQFKQQIANDSTYQACDITLQQQDLHTWLSMQNEKFDLLLFMEAAEFIADNRSLLAKLGAIAAPGSDLIMTRPAGYRGFLFPGRHQSRAAMHRALQTAGFEAVEFLPWRARYELVRAKRSAIPEAASP